MVSGLKGSRQDTDMGLIPSERASKIIIIHLRDHSFDELGPDISWVKVGPGTQTGGWGLGQSGSPGDLEESASHHIDFSRFCALFEKWSRFSSVPVKIQTWGCYHRKKHRKSLEFTSEIIHLMDLGQRYLG